MEIIATPALVLRRWMDLFFQNYHYNYVYDESLSYETAINRLRSGAPQHPELADAPELPLVAFSRSVVRPYQDAVSNNRLKINKHHQLIQEGDTVADNAVIHKIAHGEFDVRFEVYFDDISELERFEILWLTSLGASDTKRIELDTFSELGFNIPYYLSHEPLESKLFQIDGTVYKSLAGMTTVRGFYPTITGTNPLIKEIQLRVRDENEIYFICNKEITHG